MGKENKINKEFEKLSRDNPDNTIIMAGHSSFTINQLEEEITGDTEIGKKLKTVEKQLEKY